MPMDPGSRPRPGVGDQAPDFVVPGTGGRTYRLADFRGEPVVLAFYPADHSPVCTTQLRSYSENLNDFRRFGAVVLCLSPQDVASHERFAANEGLQLPLLADQDKAVGRAYGILGPLGFYRRSVFVIDGERTIRFVRRSLSSLVYVPAKQLVSALAEASARAQ